MSVVRIDIHAASSRDVREVAEMTAAVRLAAQEVAGATVPFRAQAAHAYDGRVIDVVIADEDLREFVGKVSRSVAPGFALRPDVNGRGKALHIHDQSIKNAQRVIL